MLKLENLNKTYIQDGNDLSVIDNISFDVNEGEFVSIVGPSGCGKSTILKLVSNLVLPTSGEIKFKNKSSVGLVFQKPNLLDWRTVRENIVLPLEIKREDKSNIQDLINLVALDGFENYYPSQLSDGMQQKVAIARALAPNPDILLMDEPFSAIDDFGRENLNLTLLDILEKTKKTILFVTHNLEEAVFLSDKVIILGERPAMVKEIIPINLGRPRTPDIKQSQKFQGYIRWIKETASK